MSPADILLWLGAALLGLLVLIIAGLLVTAVIMAVQHVARNQDRE